MAGILASGVPGRLPQEVYADPYFRDSNPLMDMLIAYFQKTERPPPTGKHRDGQKRSTPTTMRKQKGPIKAETAKRAANKRDSILRKLDEY